MLVNNSFLAGAPWKKIIIFALPILLGTVLQQLYNTADTIIAGIFIGEGALSAVGTCMTLTNLYLAVAQGFSIGCGVIVAQSLGAHDHEKLRRTAANGITILLAMGILCTAMSFLSTRSLLTGIIAIPAGLLPMAEDYFYFYALGFVFQFGYNIIAAVLRAVGDSKASLYFLLLSSVVNIGLDLLFIAGFRWGVQGAAIATVISQILACIVSAIYMFRRYDTFRFRVGEFRLEKRLSLDILRAGAPIVLQQMVASCGFMFIQRLVNSYGEAMTAAFTVARRIEAYLLAPTLSLQITLATYAAQNAGAKNEERTALGLRQTVLISVGITAVFSVVIFLFARPVIGLFSIAGQSMDYCVQYLRTAAMSMLIFAFYYPFVGLYQGVGKGFFSSVESSVVLGSRILLAYAMAAIPAIGYRGIWLCEPGAWVIIIVITLLYHRSGQWRQRFESSPPQTAGPVKLHPVHALKRS